MADLEVGKVNPEANPGLSETSHNFVDERSSLKEEVKQRRVIEPDKEGRDIIDWMRERYNVNISILNENKIIYKNGQKLTIKPFSDFDLLGKKLEKLKQDFCKIPPELFPRLAIKKIVLCGDTVDDYGNVVDIAENSLRGGEIYLSLVSVLWHELFHSFDDIHGGFGVNNVSSEKFETSERQNSDWTKLDPSKQPKYFQFEDEEQAFYCLYLFNADDPNVQAGAEKMIAPINDKKITQMKKWLYSWSDGLYDEVFWDDLKNGRVDENYWGNRKKTEHLIDSIDNVDKSVSD